MRARILLAVTILFNGAIAFGQNKPQPPFSYNQLSPDGKHVFVMIAPGRGDDLRSWISAKAFETGAKRTDFVRSGLYKNDGSATALWTVDWYAHKVHIASNAIHLVRLGAPTTDFDGEAVTLLANGRPIKTYRIKDFVDFSRLLPHSESQIQWLETEMFDDQNLTYTVRTHDGNRFVIDVRTGNIISSSRPYRMLLRAILGVAVLLASMYVARLAWKYHKHRKAMRALERPMLNG